MTVQCSALQETARPSGSIRCPCFTVVNGLRVSVTGGQVDVVNLGRVKARGHCTRSLPDAKPIRRLSWYETRTGPPAKGVRWLRSEYSGVFAYVDQREREV